jgi:fructose-specific phosphotransferase system IIC component
MRVFSGVVLGYLLFELLWRGLFLVTDTVRHASVGISFELGVAVFGLLFALLAGYVASFIGGRPHCNAAWMAGSLVALTAIVIMFRNVVAWPQVFQLLFMAPAVVVGGSTYVLRRRDRAGGQDEGK